MKKYLVICILVIIAATCAPTEYLPVKKVVTPILKANSMEVALQYNDSSFYLAIKITDDHFYDIGQIKGTIESNRYVDYYFDDNNLNSSITFEVNSNDFTYSSVRHSDVSVKKEEYVYLNGNQHVTEYIIYLGNFRSELIAEVEKFSITIGEDTFVADEEQLHIIKQFGVLLESLILR